MSEVLSIYVYNGEDGVPRDITHIRVDPSVTIIPNGAFKNRCPKLVEVELPEGLITIERDAFANCILLKRINIPSTVLEIHRDAFSECYNLLDGITLPEGLQRLDHYAFYNCTSLQRINIPPNLERIGRGAFLFCRRLSEVALSEGLEVIGKDAFAGCKLLSSVTLPSSLNVIEEEAFDDCEVLNEIHMPETVECIGARAFKKCNFTNFRMPSSIGDDVDISLVEGNSCLVSLELPENARLIKFGKESHSLRNIALPSQCTVGHIGTMWIHHKDLKVALLGTDDDEDDGDDTRILNALQHRFDDLPIHKICYYRSYFDNDTSMQHLKREVNPWTSNPPGRLNTTGKEQDCLGMTPLHILACSTNSTVEMYLLLIDKYPETLIMKDKWGDIPLMYAIWCNAPAEVVDLLVESYKSIHPKFEFDWSGMIQTLSKRNVPLANIQRLVKTQQSSFPNQDCDMQQVVLELVTYDTRQAGFNKPCTAVDTVQYLLRVSITKRLDILGISRWHKELENSINALPKNAKYGMREVSARKLYDRLAIYESIKEGTSVLELTLWKAKIDDSHNKRARVSEEDTSYKEQCRVNCGADIIIRNVLPYLLPVPDK